MRVYSVVINPVYISQMLCSLKSIKFYLPDLLLMREYLDIEFHDIKLTLSFDYNLERVIDDFLLLADFVSNNFLPDLPHLYMFGAKALEVIEYSWKDGRYSKVSEKAVELIQDYKVCLVTMRLGSIAHNSHNSSFLKSSGDETEVAMVGI